MLQSLLPTCLMILLRKHGVLLKRAGLRMLLIVLITELQKSWRFHNIDTEKNVSFCFGWCQYVLNNKNKILQYIKNKSLRQKHYWIWIGIGFGFVFQSTERLQDALENSSNTPPAWNTITKGDLKFPVRFWSVS